MAEDNMSGSTGFGFQFSAVGAVIMFLLYLVQVTDTAEFFLEPTVTLSVAILAALGAVLFYFGRSPET